MVVTRFHKNTFYDPIIPIVTHSSEDEFTVICAHSSEKKEKKDFHLLNVGLRCSDVT